MKTGAMLAIAGQMDQCGFESLEFFGFAGFLKYVREHKENPFDWLRLGAKKFRRTRLRYHGGRSSGFEKIPRSVRALLIERVVAHGITLTRSSDPWNDYDAAAGEIRALRRIEMRKYGGPGVSDEELVLRVIAGQAAVKEMIAAGAPREYPNTSQPLVSLIDELSRNKKLSQVYIRKGDFSLALKRS